MYTINKQKLSLFPCAGFTRGHVCACDETRSNSEVIPCGPTLELFNSDAQTSFINTSRVLIFKYDDIVFLLNANV